MSQDDQIKIVQATLARKELQQVIDQVHYTHQPAIISKHGKPWVVIQALPEADEIMQQSKRRIKRTNRANGADDKKLQKVIRQSFRNK